MATQNDPSWFDSLFLKIQAAVSPRIAKQLAIRGHPQRDTLYRTALNDLHGRVGAHHVPITSGATASGPPGQLPPVEVSGPLVYAVFDTAAGNQKMYRVFKVPYSFVDTPQVHIHWTKSDDVDRSGETVRWTVTYTVFDGGSEDGDGAGTVLTFDDAYDSAGTTERVVYRTEDLDLIGVEAGYYVAVSVEKGTPASGSAMVEPALVSFDFTCRAYLNREGD